jgi:hypothetical protein
LDSNTDVPSTMSFTLDYASIEHPKWKNLPPPPDFSNLHTTHTRTPAKTAAASYAALKEKRAWDLAIAPAKSLPMQAFMLYMSGGGVQIFSMGIVVMLLLSPVMNIAGMNAAFTPFSPSPSPTALPLQKLTYVLCNVLTLLVGLWKCRSMGLFPAGTGDWLAFETRGMVRFHPIGHRSSFRVRRDALFFEKSFFPWRCSLMCFSLLLSSLRRYRSGESYDSPAVRRFLVAAHSLACNTR